MEWIQDNIITVVFAALMFWILWKRLVAPKLAGVKNMAASDYMTFRRDEHTVLDVRSVGEWESGHPSQAMHIALGELAQRMHEIPKDKPLVVVCASGNRSAMAATQLAQSGFENVYNFSGGMGAWRSAGLPIKSGT